MKAERIFRALGLVDPDLIAEAAPGGPAAVRRKPAWRAVIAAAACFAIICTIGSWFVGTGGFRAGSSNSPLDPSSSGGASEGMGVNSAEDGGTVFMQYAGPVFPLSTLEPPEGFTAERTITWDFSPGAYEGGEPRQWGANVTDAYVLTNTTSQEITVNAIYPFAGQFSELDQQLPSVALDDAQVEAKILAGAYSGGFQSTFGADTPDTMNLDTLDSWTEYKILLDSGEYLSQALEDAPVLDIPVTVYGFTDFTAPHETYQAATQAISFQIDETATRIFTYGINGYEGRDDGFRRYSYFVPDGMRRESGTKLLIILGEDIQDYVLQGYQDGGCEDGEEIDGVSCAVTRTETTLDAVLDQLCRMYMEEYTKGLPAGQTNLFDATGFAMYRRAVSELMIQYGPLDTVSMDRYQDGRLDDILSETLSHDRVLYLKVPVSIPAGGSIRVVFQFWKSPSFDFHCGSDNEGLQGYDMVTQLGSTLDFTSQTASLENTDSIEVLYQNFGFDIENGVLTAALNPDQEHYFLEIRERES